MLGKKSHKEKTILALDIGSASVGAALVHLTKNAKPEILFSVRKELVFQENVSLERLSTSLEESLEEVCADIIEKGMPLLSGKRKNFSLDSIVCSYASPWYISQTQTITIHKDEPFTITATTIPDLLKSHQAEQVSAIDETDAIAFPTDVVFLEQKIIETTLNGYRVTQPIGKMVSDLSVTVYTSTISEALYDRVEEILGRLFGSTPIEHHSFPLISFSVARDVFAATENFLLIDISGEVTDITYTEKNTIVETISFPQGVHFLTRELNKKMGVLPGEVSHIVGRRTKRHTSPGESVALKTIGADTTVITTVQETWGNAVREHIRLLKRMPTLPQMILVTVDMPLSALFIDALSEMFKGTSPRSLEIVPLDIESLAPFYSSTKIAGRSDPFVVSIGLYAAKLFDVT